MRLQAASLALCCILALSGCPSTDAARSDVRAAAAHLEETLQDPQATPEQVQAARDTLTAALETLRETAGDETQAWIDFVKGGGSTGGAVGLAWLILDRLRRRREASA